MKNYSKETLEKILNRKYPVVIYEITDPDDGEKNYYAFHPDFGHAACSAVGDTEFEALELLETTKKDVILFCIETGKELPMPSRYPSEDNLDNLRARIAELEAEREVLARGILRCNRHTPVRWMEFNLAQKVLNE